MGDREIVSGSSFRECFKPLWAGTASERSYLALVLLAQSSLGPSPAQVFMQLHVNLGVNPAENGVGSLFQTVPWAGLPRCCTNSSCGEGVVMNWNWASYGRFCFSVFYFSVFLFFLFFIFLCISKLFQAECQPHDCTGFPLPPVSRQWFFSSSASLSQLLHVSKCVHCCCAEYLRAISE